MSAEEIVALTKKHSLFSWSAYENVNPMPISRAEGVYVWNFSGQRFIDLNSQLMCVNIGHGNKHVIDAITKQASEVTYVLPTFTTEVRARLGQMLAEITPGDLNRFFFTLGGSEANENALRAARIVTGRQKVMSRYRSYHGATAGSISLTGDPRRWANEPGIPGVIRVFDPHKYRSSLYREGDSEVDFSQRCLEQIEEVMIYEGPHTIAAIFIETVTGTNGLIIPPNGYLKGLRSLCDKYGILMICDEVMCGIGRTGKWFAVDHWQVVPDIITMAKGLTSAYLPLGAVAFNDKVSSFFKKNTFFGGLTYNAHPVCLAASKACLEVMIADDLCGNATRVGQTLSKCFQNFKLKHPSVGDVRSIGLFGAIEIVRNRVTKEPMGPFYNYNGTTPEMIALVAFLRSNGILASTSSNLLFVNPPLCITDNQLSEALEVIDRALEITDKGVTN